MTELYVPTTDDKLAENTIYTPMPHRYGYLIRVAHPEVLPYYEAFKTEHGIPLFFPPGDKLRFEFEQRVLSGYYPIRLQRAETTQEVKK